MRRNKKFIPQIGKQILASAVVESDMKQQDSENNVFNFYNQCIFYLELWEDSFESVDQFS